MALGRISRFGGRVAALVALSALLLQASCTIGLVPLATAEAAQPADFGCHESAPATPAAPASGQKCCNGDRSPVALLTASPVVAAQFATVEAVHEIFAANFPSRHAAEIATPSAGPPRLVALRI